MKIPTAFIEPLESRIAPATLLTYTDVDGDKIHVALSNGSLLVSTTAEGVGLQINEIQVVSGTNANLTVSIFAKAAHGDGLVNVGEIVADSGVTLGKVSVSGDLGRIVAVGNGTDTDGVIKSINVRSMGNFGTATGATPNGNGTVQSVIGGGVGSLNVKDDINGSLIEVLGKLGAVNVKGSLIGGTTTGSGEILGALAMGPINIGGGILGGSGTSSGSIDGSAGIKSVTVGKSVVGSFGAESGYVLNNSAQTLGPVKIGGSLESGTNSFSGTINSFGDMTGVTIGGSIIGGDDEGGSIFMQLSGGTIGSVKVGQNVIGAFNANDSGTISGSGNVGAISIGGSLVGGGSNSDTDSGSILFTGNIGAIKIGGDFQIGRHVGCGEISAGGALGSLAVKSWDTGLIEATGNIGALSLGTYFAGSFESTTGNIKSVFIAGDLTGQNNNTAAQDIDSIVIDGSVTNITGITATGGIIGSLVVKGSVEPGCNFESKFDFVSAKISGNFFGGISSSVGNVDSVTIAGDMNGGDVFAAEGSIGSVKIGGSAVNSEIIAGLLNSSTKAIKIGSIKVGGDWIASSVSSGFRDVSNNGYGNDDDALVAQSGTIGSIVIGGQIIGTAGIFTDHFGFDAQSISVFKTGGNTIAVGSVTQDITLSNDTGGDVAIHISPV